LIFTQDLPEIGIRDYEWVEVWRLAGGWVGPLRYNAHEVSEVAWISPQELTSRMSAAPEEFTPWFLDEVRTSHLLLLGERGP
jgi:isopentenyldiphosphate isomerase